MVCSSMAMFHPSRAEETGFTRAEQRDPTESQRRGRATLSPSAPSALALPEPEEYPFPRRSLTISATHTLPSLKSPKGERWRK